MSIIKIKTQSGKTISYDTEKFAGSGTQKDVWFSPDKSYVVAFYKNKLTFEGKRRLEKITGQYREAIFETPEGDYWKKRLCWVSDVFEHEGKDGIVLPTYDQCFFFEHGSYKNDICSIKGTEKSGRWFASARHQQWTLDPRERGDWQKYLKLSLDIARGVNRLHLSGLAHSDLSYKNVLVDPLSGRACIIDIDTLVVPQMFPPEVIGTPDFIAPEVVATSHIPTSDHQRKLPSIHTDLHALAVLIYMYLVYRHPLRGSKCHSSDDPILDDKLLMGEKALFIEHPTDASNRLNLKHANPDYLPWIDIQQRPYTLTGPYLKGLFDQAFITGLHTPLQRPTANQWVRELVKTMDLLQPCANTDCPQKWYLFDNTTLPKCPFCGTVYRGLLPVLNFYSQNQEGGRYNSENSRLMVYEGQYLNHWHVNKNIFPHEGLPPEQKKPVGYFSKHQGKWVFINQTLDGMLVIDKASGNKVPVAINSMLEIKDNQQILLSGERGGRLVHVQMTGKQ